MSANQPFSDSVAPDSGPLTIVPIPLKHPTLAWQELVIFGVCVYLVCHFTADKKKK